VKKKCYGLGKLGENGTKGVSNSSAERGTSSKSSKCDGPHLGGRECMGQYTELAMEKWVTVQIVVMVGTYAGWNRCSCTTTLDSSEDVDHYFVLSGGSKRSNGRM
jgi:hypothetical protein